MRQSLLTDYTGNVHKIACQAQCRGPSWVQVSIPYYLQLNVLFMASSRAQHASANPESGHLYLDCWYIQENVVPGEGKESDTTC